MTRMFYDKDANLDNLKGLRIAVLGYGSQGHAHAQNLKESGMDVVVGLHEGSRSRKRAEDEGFRVTTAGKAVSEADVVVFLVPDHVQADLYETEVKPNLKPGATLVFSHGFTVHYHQVVPPSDADVFMIAPKSPGHLVRRMFTEGKGVPGLIAIYQDRSGKTFDKGLAYGSAIGCGRAGIIETTFAEETETDLFGEQAVLCGGVTELVKAGFDTLVDAGYQPEIAYFECLNELKLIVDMMFEGGLGWMRYSVSDTAKYGDKTAGRKVIDEHVRATMRDLLEDVQSGEFAKDWILENRCGRPSMKKWEERENRHLIEEVGSRLRKMMPWMDAKEAPKPGV
ncbi:MAG: ketol-acid reductoisomerase [Synergistota bacterium]|nr:ketol-acid reductoisomerase [Synergistota bacterium]